MSTPSTPVGDLQARESFAQMIWGGGIVLFFVVQMTLWAVALYVTHNDPTHRVVADFDQRAESWDQHKQDLQSSQSLGWTAKIEVAPEADLRGFRKVTLIVTDQNQTPIALDSVHLSTFHRARAAEQVDLEMKATAPNVWQGSARMKRSGRWQFDGLAEKGHQKLIIDEDVRLSFDH